MVVWLKRSEEEVRIVVNSSRVLVTHQRQTSGDVHVVTSNLTVHNVSTVDGGEYLCVRLQMVKLATQSATTSM